MEQERSGNEYIYIYQLNRIAFSLKALNSNLRHVHHGSVRALKTPVSATGLCLVKTKLLSPLYSPVYASHRRACWKVLKKEVNSNMTL